MIQSEMGDIEKSTSSNGDGLYEQNDVNAIKYVKKNSRNSRRYHTEHKIVYR